MIDLTLLNKLMGNDSARVGTFLRIFKTEIPRQLSALRTALSEGKLEDASNIAHAIKSQARYLNAEDIAEVAMKIETTTETGSFTAANEAELDTLESMLQRLLADRVFNEAES